MLSTRCTGCLTAVNYQPIMICCSVDVGIYTLLLKEKEASGSSSRQRAAYIRDRTLHCLRCFILLTQLRRQPTLALSTEAHGLQRDPDSSALAGAPDKASRCAIGDGVKTVIRHEARAGSPGGDIQRVRLSCNMSRACRNV